MLGESCKFVFYTEHYDQKSLRILLVYFQWNTISTSCMSVQISHLTPVLLDFMFVHQVQIVQLSLFSSFKEVHCNTDGSQGTENCFSPQYVIQADVRTDQKDDGIGCCHGSI